jgi:CRISPR-associated endonuclease/helicase Cas3
MNICSSRSRGGSVGYRPLKNEAGVYHDLEDHLREVAELAHGFAQLFDPGNLAYYLGLWHDLGKFHPDWQAYLQNVEQGKVKKGGPDHKAAGAKLAADLRLGLLAPIIRAHHGGLCNEAEFAGWLAEKSPRVSSTLDLAKHTLPDLLPPTLPSLPSFLTQPGLTRTEKLHRLEFFTRMLFSALVDADFLSTERHLNTQQTDMRAAPLNLAELWRRFDLNQTRLVGAAPDTLVNRLRQAMYAECLAHVHDAPGLFRLTMPTGGGKTRAALAFALQHALHHGQQRIIIAVPFTTITTQTAAICRAIFDTPGDRHTAVLEHYSTAEWHTADPEDSDPETAWLRLASENWDAPIIVTTTVQLFESLFSHRTSTCRKLHRLANSVIILDEVQALPTHVLDPILAGISELAQHYGSTIVLSTATQPTFDLLKPFHNLPATNLIADPAPYFHQLSRVTYDRSHLAEPLAWADLAQRIESEVQVLVIVNTKQDALDLVKLLPDVSHRFHLSTALCGAHRKAVLDSVRDRLSTNQACWLVTTQLVEAGVDIDFPLVWRALAPLESIVQAAGRCNREGRLDQPGRVMIFRSEGDHLPPGAYTRATGQARTTLSEHPETRPDDLALLEIYFTQLYDLYGQDGTDREQIQAFRESRAFRTVSERFRLINDDTISVIVPYGDARQQTEIDALCQRLRLPWEPHRMILRQLQPFMVNLYLHQAQRFQQWLDPIDPRNPTRFESLRRWTARYDATYGLVGADLPIDNLIV